MQVGLCRTAYNTEFPQLEDDACDWDAAGTPKRYPKCPYPSILILSIWNGLHVDMNVCFVNVGMNDSEGTEGMRKDPQCRGSY